MSGQFIANPPSRAIPSEDETVPIELAMAGELHIVADVVVRLAMLYNDLQKLAHCSVICYRLKESPDVYDVVLLDAQNDACVCHRCLRAIMPSKRLDAHTIKMPTSETDGIIRLNICCPEHVLEGSANATA